MGRQRADSYHRDQRNLSTQFRHRFTRRPRTRSRQSVFGSGSAVPHALLDDSGPSPRRLRIVESANGRQIRVQLPTDGHLGGGHLRKEEIPARQGESPLSSQPIHLLASHHRPHHVLRHRQAPSMRSQTLAYQHPHACPHHNERRNLRGSGSCPGRSPAARCQG